jgi:hypothetical protein
MASRRVRSSAVERNETKLEPLSLDIFVRSSRHKRDITTFLLRSSSSASSLHTPAPHQSLLLGDRLVPRKKRILLGSLPLHHHRQPNLINSRRRSRVNGGRHRGRSPRAQPSRTRGSGRLASRFRGRCLFCFLLLLQLFFTRAPHSNEQEDKVDTEDPVPEGGAGAGAGVGGGGGRGSIDGSAMKRGKGEKG